MIIEEFMSLVASYGYKAHLGPSGLRPHASVCAYKRIESKRICELNGQAPEIELYFYASNRRISSSIEARVCGVADGFNRKIEIYGKTPEEFIAQIDAIEAALVRMWEA